MVDLNLKILSNILKALKHRTRESKSVQVKPSFPTSFLWPQANFVVDKQNYSRAKQISGKADYFPAYDKSSVVYARLVEIYCSVANQRAVAHRWVML